VTVAEVDDPDGGAMVKSSPVPVRFTVCGLPAALSAIVIVPVQVPPAEGVKVTVTVQFAPAATLAPQVLVWAKSPLATILEIESGALPELVNVTV